MFLNEKPQRNQGVQHEVFELAAAFAENTDLTNA
jgi:hypothetical protein